MFSTVKVYLLRLCCLRVPISCYSVVTCVVVCTHLLLLYCHLCVYAIVATYCVTCVGVRISCYSIVTYVCMCLRISCYSIVTCVCKHQLLLCCYLCVCVSLCVRISCHCVVICVVSLLNLKNGFYEFPYVEFCFLCCVRTW